MSADDDRYFGIVAKELALGRHKQELWNRACALSNGEADATTARYIRLRVEQLRRSQDKAKGLAAGLASRPMPDAGGAADAVGSAEGNQAERQLEEEPVRAPATAHGSGSRPRVWFSSSRLRCLVSWGLIIALPFVAVAVFFDPIASRFGSRAVMKAGTVAPALSATERREADVRQPRHITSTEVTSSPSISRAPLGVASMQRRGDTQVVQVSVSDVFTLPFLIDSRASETLVPTDALDLLARDPSASSMYIGTFTKQLANGMRAEYPRILLRSLDVSGVRVENVIAEVTPKGGVPVLGMSFLERLEGFSVDTLTLTLSLGELNPLLGPWDSGAADVAARTRHKDVVDRLAKANVDDDIKQMTPPPATTTLALGDELFRLGSRLTGKRQSRGIDHADDLFKIVGAHDRSRGHGADVMCAPAQEPPSLNQAQSELFWRAQAGVCIGHRFLLLALEERQEPLQAAYYLAGEHFFAHALRSLAALNLEKVSKDVGERLATSFNVFVLALKDDPRRFSPRMKALAAQKEVERYDSQANHIVWAIRAGLLMYQQ